MRKLVSIILSLLLCGVLSDAQTTVYTYDKTKGKEKAKVVWQETVTPKGKDVVLKDGSKTYTQSIGADDATVKWHYVNTANGTDYTVVFNGDIYRISGKVKGKAIDKEEHTSGYPWCQNISVKGGPLLKKKGDKLTYECIRPDTGGLQHMVATNVGTTTINGIAVNDLKVTPAGALSKMWSCHDFCDASTGVLVKFQAVEGIPGTPETIWILEK